MALGYVFGCPVDISLDVLYKKGVALGLCGGAGCLGLGSDGVASTDVLEG